MSDKLSMGWEFKSLVELGTFIRGVTYKKDMLVSSSSPDAIKILRSNNIQKKVDLTELKYLPKSAIKEYQIIKNNDILFCMSNGSKKLVGKNVLIKSLPKSSFGAFCSVFRSNDCINPLFISYYLVSDNYKNAILKFSKGSGILNLKNSQLETLTIPIPPIQEQKKIVKVLDATLGKIDQAITLVNQNIEKLEQLNASVLDEIFKGLKAPKLTWDDVLTIINGKNQRKVQNPNGKYPIYGSGGIMNYADDYLCPENTVIVGRKGTINNPLFIKTKFWNVDTAFGICAGEKLNPKFLYYFCRNFNFKNLNKSTTLPSLAKRDLLKIKMIVPALNKQKLIVKYLDHTTEKNNQLIQHYQNKLQSLQDLKKSVLDSAFKGKLKREVVKVEKEVNLPFYQMQLIGLSIQANKQDNIPQGEMAIAKDMYLLDKLYGVNTKMDFVNHSWGPFAPEIKKRVTNKQYFGRKNFPNSQATYLDIVNEEMLLGKVDANIKQQVFKAIQDLNTKLFLKVSKYDRAEVKELLATVLKCIEDMQTTELSAIREAMHNWKIKQDKYKTKAEKFTEADTEKMLLFIQKQNWHNNLIK